jgi:hypothetical protein
VLNLVKSSFCRTCGLTIIVHPSRDLSMNLSQSHDPDRKFDRLVQVDMNFRLGFIENILGKCN